MKAYLKNVLIAFDQFWNAAGGGNPDETISSRVGRGAVAGKWWALVAERVIDGMPWFGKGHCRGAIGT